MHIIPCEINALFQAVSDATRLRVIRLLATTGEEACLCELVHALDEPAYKLSRHLKTLSRTGLVAAQKEGRWVYHRVVADPALSHLYQFLLTMPDPKGVFAADTKRFIERLRLREKGRCRSTALLSPGKREVA